MNYIIESDLSSGDDHSVKPGKGSKPHKQNHYTPLGGPSAGRIQAQKQIDDQQAHMAASVLLELQDSGIDNAMGNNTSTSGSNTLSSSGKSEETVSIDENSSNEHSANCITSTSSHISSDSNSEPNCDDKNTSEISTKDKNNVSNSNPSEGVTNEDDIPLSELRSKFTKGKPYFKTTAFELVKHKHHHLFKCISCNTTEKRQRKINDYY